MAAETVTVDRDLLERFIIDVYGFAVFETLRVGGWETPFAERIYFTLYAFERAVFGPIADSDEEHDRLHSLGYERGRQYLGELHEKVTLDAR